MCTTVTEPFKLCVQPIVRTHLLFTPRHFGLLFPSHVSVRVNPGITNRWCAKSNVRKMLPSVNIITPYTTAATQVHMRRFEGVGCFLDYNLRDRSHVSEFLQAFTLLGGAV